MLTFLIILGIFIFSRNKVEDTSAPKHKRATYEEEVRKVNTQRSVTTPQLQDAS